MINLLLVRRHHKALSLLTAAKKKCMSLHADATSQLFWIAAAFWSYTILKMRQMRKSFIVKLWIFRSRMEHMSRPSTWPLITEEYQWLL